MNGLITLLIVVAIILGGLGATMAGTTGLASIGLACLLGILARIAQAGQQHREIMARRNKVLTATTK